MKWHFLNSRASVSNSCLSDHRILIPILFFNSLASDWCSSLSQVSACTSHWSNKCEDVSLLTQHWQLRWILQIAFIDAWLEDFARTNFNWPKSFSEFSTELGLHLTTSVRTAPFFTCLASTTESLPLPVFKTSLNTVSWDKGPPSALSSAWPETAASLASSSATFEGSCSGE